MAPGSGVFADRRLCLTADKAVLVEENDPRAATLLSGEGGELLAEDIARLGLVVVDGRVEQAKPFFPEEASEEVEHGQDEG